MRVQRGPDNPSAINQSAERVLYVEGQPASEGLDVRLLRPLLPVGWAIRAAGNSADVLGAARALATPHPKWVFVVDRDHFDDDRVAKTWRDFDPQKGANLLIWRRKELENQFLEPEWLAESKYLKPGVSADTLREEIRVEMSRGLWRILVDRVVAQVRYRVKAAPSAAKPAKGPAPANQVEAEALLLDSPQLRDLRQTADAELSEAHLKMAFDAEVQEITGGQTELSWGVGRWRDLLPGKSVFKGLVNRHFPVEADTRSRLGASTKPARLAVEDAMAIVAEDLFVQHRAQMPTDFHDLRAKLALVK